MSFDKRRALQNALLYTQQGKWDRAIAEYQAIRKAEPADLSVCNNLGDLFARAGRTGEAIEQYRTLGESYRTDGLSVKAIAVYKKIAKLDPSWTEAYLACGDLYLEQGLVGEAKLQFATAAQLYAKTGEAGKVVEIYQRLAQLEPANLSVLTKLAELLAKQGSPAAAAAEYERAAQAAESAGQRAEAQRLLKRARELAPAAGPSLAAGEALLAEGRAGEAAAVFAALSAEEPENPTVWRRLGEAEAAAERPAGALRALQEGLRHGLREAEVADLLGRLLLAQGQTAEAEALCGRVVEEALARGEPAEAAGRCRALLAAAPGLLGVHRRLVELWETLGREAEAADAARALGEACEAAGQAAGAVEAYRTVLRHAPGDPAAAARLAALAPEPTPAAPAPAEPDLAEFQLLLEDDDALAGQGDAGAAEAQPVPATPPELPELVELAPAEAPDLPGEPAAWSEAAEPQDVQADGPVLSLAEEPPALQPLAMAEEPAGPAAPQPGAFTATESLPGTPEAAAPAEALPAAAPAPAGDFSLSPEGSLDFLGGSEGLGGLSLDEDDLPSGQAAEQLAEAEVYLKYGLEEKARERLVEVVRLSPNSVTVRRKLKHLYRDQGQVGEACEQIAAIARILEERQRHDAAREELREGLELSPDHAELRRLLAGEPAPGAAPPPATEAAAPAPPPSVAPSPRGPEPPLEVALPGVEAEAAPGAAPPAELLPLLDVETEAAAPPAASAAGLPVEEELPPELRALLAQPEEPSLVVEGVTGEGDAGLADDLAEAEFYLAQGMREEARGVCRRLQAAHADDPAVAALAARLARDSGAVREARGAEPEDAPAAPAAPPAPAAGAPAPDAPRLTVQEGPAAPEGAVDLAGELRAELAGEPGAESGEAALMNGLLSELQRGVREQVDTKDYETHYNLGIAYKEMDLFDEAIQEFQLAGADPRRALDCAELLGQCFLAKGQPEAAAAELRAGLGLAGHPAEAYRGLRYTLGLAYEALGEPALAAEQFAALEREQPRFRDAAARLAALRARLTPPPAARPAAPPPPAAAAPKRRKISFI
ncbi:MAG: tetratricopeptide repeat protein [Candidatus Methylomirabilales bacterium]